MPSKSKPAADEAASLDVSTDSASSSNDTADYANADTAQSAAPAAQPPSVPAETGDEQTAERTVLARNSGRTLLTLEDGTPFPHKRKKWLTAAEAARFKRMGAIVILNE